MSTPQAQQPPQRFEEEEPPFPEKPDCCLGGCVLDGYTEEVEAWEKRVSEIRARRAAREQQQQQQEQQ